MQAAVTNGGLEAEGCLRGGPGLPGRCLSTNGKESLPAPLGLWQPRNNTCLCFISGHALENSGRQKPTRIFRKRWWQCGMQRGNPGGNFTRLGLSRERCTAPSQFPAPRDARPRSGSWDFWGSRNSQSSPWLHSTGPQWWQPPLGN